MDTTIVRVISERVEEGVEKRTFTITRTAAEQSEFYKNCLNATPNEIRIPAEPGIRDVIVEKVHEFLEYRASHPDQKDEMDKKALDRTMTDNLSEWDKNFISSVDLPTHMRILLAANFLNIPSLLLVAQKQLANNIKERKAEDLKEYFKIPEETSEDQRKP